MSDAREWLMNDTLGTVTVDFWSRYAAMKNALLAVLDLHRSVGVLKDVPTCWGCGMDVPWPCPTVRAINDALGIGDDSRREGYECEW